jgi:hypothetical protein
VWLLAPRLDRRQKKVGLKGKRRPSGRSKQTRSVCKDSKCLQSSWEPVDWSKVTEPLSENEQGRGSPQHDSLAELHHSVLRKIVEEGDLEHRLWIGRPTEGSTEPQCTHLFFDEVSSVQRPAVQSTSQSSQDKTRRTL